MNLNWVNSRIAVGGAVEPNEVQDYIKAGITHVVDCRSELDDTKLFAGSGVNVLWIGVDDDGQSKSDSWFQAGIQFSLDALARRDTKVNLHCAAGINRGPSMCYAVLRALGFSAERAEAMIREVRPQVGIAYKVDADRAIVSLGYVS